MPLRNLDEAGVLGDEAGQEALDRRAGAEDQGGGGAVVGGCRGTGDLDGVEVGSPVGQGQEAAGRQGLAESGDDAGRVPVSSALA
jgi:hypothetical protein